MFELAVKAHALLGHHVQGLQQNPSTVPMGPNEVREDARPAGGGVCARRRTALAQFGPVRG